MGEQKEWEGLQGSAGAQEADAGAPGDASQGTPAPQGPAKRGTNKRLNIIIGVVLVAVVAIACAMTSGLLSSGSNAQVVIRDGNGNEQTLPLNVDTELTVSTDAGWNRIVIEGGSVRVAEADCPHQDCVDKGAISSVGQQIVCLPHELIVTIVEEGTQASYDVIGS